MTIVVFTGIVGLWIAPGTLSPFKAISSILCLALGSGAAGALNMWYERDIDSLMERTRRRPLPEGILQPKEALCFGLLLAVVAVGGMALFINILAAFYLGTAILFYIGVYTIWLKRRTPQNIVIGGAAGALPPVIGWASVVNETSLLPWILFGIIFLWTPPHFWSLALYRHADYVKANVPMLPGVAGPEATKTYILYYLFALVPLTLLPFFLGEFGPFYGGVAFLLDLTFLGIGFKVKYSQDPKEGMPLFFFSILYLFLLFGAVMGDVTIRHNQ